MSHTILRLPEVIKRTGLSRSSIYLRVANKEFPAPLSLGGRAVGWLEQNVDEWIVARIEQSKVTDLG
jgi:prophage regulatory protein